MMTSFPVSTVLLLAVAGGCLAAGILLGVEVVGAITRRRERRIAQERRALNAVWRRLRDQFGIARLSWLQDFLDRPDVFDDRVKVGSAGIHACGHCHGSDSSRTTDVHRR
ncbi:hypothetical protein [Amycolatopsis sp. NPDC004378]